MNFFDAMKELKKGNKVRNTLWKDDMYLYTENKTIRFSEACIKTNLHRVELNEGTWELYKKSILDKTEKAYLNNVIKPFKNKVSYIVKDSRLMFSCKYVFINICVKTYFKTYEYISLPTFISDSMYKNMKLGYKYSLKELGLDD